MTLDEKAMEAACLIEDDIASRCGIGAEWYMIDEETKLEILVVWAKIIRKYLD